MITALELLAGIHEVPPEKFPDLRRQVELAFALSKGRILEEPVALICNEVLNIQFPLTAPEEDVVSAHLDVIRRAGTVKQILEGRVPVKGGTAGFKSTSAIYQAISNLKQEWIDTIEKIATDTYTEWREHFEREGKRLPHEMCKEFELPSAMTTRKRSLTEYFLRWLGANAETAEVDSTMNKLDGSLDFANFVLREFLTRNYKLEKHSSDVFDHFQLRYLALDRFVIVTNDSDLSNRTSQSPQNARIVTFEQFLRTL